MSATVAAATASGAVAGLVGLALLALPRKAALASGVVVLALAIGIAIDAGAAQSAAPLWGAGLLVAAALAERALALPRNGAVEADALAAWLSGVAVLAGAGLASGALVLLAATTGGGTTAAGLVAAALLAAVPVAVARRFRR